MIDTRMNFGELIQKHRERLGLSRGDLVQRLQSRGFKLPRTTLQNWEAQGRHWTFDWNPGFLEALAESLEIDELELLHELGFPVIPEGYTIEDMQLAKRIREAPLEKRREAVRALLAVLDALGIE